MKPEHELQRFIHWCADAAKHCDVDTKTLHEYGNQVFEIVAKYIHKLKNCNNCRNNHQLGWKKECYVEEKGKYCFEVDFPKWKVQK